ncbi:hypothetical protein [Maritimibacter sp. UBA3975]|uniref:hypothetical protein n=1 Tax=Maritimibacter sp. UBA3975 TaxID=1946833 RepID=UPI000C09C6C6|nr:hypothetical protein [Maritimibacter sp. UBA3975]MAM63871.1 hypothetical protein [Maritimibacter sp.]|tara:strand:+ start:64404 stop:64781 length:378 start_codon:yes stop_codon:yes gene_type:complete
MPKKLGEIFRFETQQAVGRATRTKYHLAIDLGQGAFLFINSDPFEGAMRITRADWPEMPKEESFVSCTAVIRYTRADLQGVPIQQAGRLTDDCLRRLEDHVSKSWVLTIQEIEMVCQAFRVYFET